MDRLSPSHSAEIEELLGAYALDALEPEEASLVEAHLDTCPRCRQEVAAHLEVAGKLGSLGQEAPPLVWDKIAANLRVPPPSLSTAPPNPVSALPVSSPRPESLAHSAARRDRGGRASRRRVITVVAGLVAAAVIVVLGIGVIRLNNRVDKMSARLPSSPIPTPAAVAAAIVSPGAQQTALAPLGGGPALAQVVIDRDGIGYMYDSRMPALASDRTYELWGIVDGVRVPYSVLGADPTNVSEFVAKGPAVALAVTVERVGGVSTSDHSPVGEASLSTD